MGTLRAEAEFLGIIVPYDFALDREIWRWTPKRVSLLITRTAQLGLPSTVAMAESISTDRAVRNATRRLLTTDPAAIVYLCTSGSFIRGAAGEEQMRAVMRKAGAPAAVTTAGALVQACRALDISKIAVATPYIDSVTQRLHTFLDESAVDVVSSIGLGREDRIWQVPEENIVDLVHAADDPRADAVFVSCTNLRTYGLIRQLEIDLGKPVLTANQVSIWAALRAAGIQQPDIKQRLFIDTWRGSRRRPPSETTLAALESQPLARRAVAPKVVGGGRNLVQP
ncbi:Asp/Glu/hydantoin racemase [Antrihabitans sp. YC2-6]|uniref:maleate cis-trans isomerase family protein n=1 Tax=Antrihabitans sp. YC2-6 TaxID=2799498 RepID=UPI0018F391DC|nr:Asp/Glu/hydantoin racemase [Antrihabitans sp. YC2-6]MBJ8345718.1 Asp/Glu/hydantoin racemase [Antrihabitans sp. YC2-6]